MSDNITITTISAVDDASGAIRGRRHPGEQAPKPARKSSSARTAPAIVAKSSLPGSTPAAGVRETPTVVVHDAVDDEIVMLLRTTVGEWCVRCVDSGTGHADGGLVRHRTRQPRSLRRPAQQGLCICGAECDADEIDRSGDEPQCPKCVRGSGAPRAADRGAAPAVPTHGDTVNCYCTTGACTATTAATRRRFALPATATTMPARARCRRAGERWQRRAR